MLHYRHSNSRLYREGAREHVCVCLCIFWGISSIAITVRPKLSCTYKMASEPFFQLLDGAHLYNHHLAPFRLDGPT